MKLVVRDKTDYYEQTSERMNRHFIVPEWTIRQKLASVCRMLAEDGHDSVLLGQLSARADKAITLSPISASCVFKVSPELTSGKSRRKIPRQGMGQT